jgi:hypothetical protein
MIEGVHPGQDAAHLGGREDDGQFELGIGTDQFHLGGPGTAEGFLPEELDGAEGLGGSLTGDLLDRLEVKEVVAEVFGREAVGGSIEVFAQLADTGVTRLKECRERGGAKGRRVGWHWKLLGGVKPAPVFSAFPG